MFLSKLSPNLFVYFLLTIHYIRAGKCICNLIMDDCLNGTPLTYQFKGLKARLGSFVSIPMAYELHSTDSLIKCATLGAMGDHVGFLYYPGTYCSDTIHSCNYYLVTY